MIQTLHYRLQEVSDYINWSYFFHAWGFPARFASIASIHGCDSCRAIWLADFPQPERKRAAEAMQLHKEALRMLVRLGAEGYRVHVRFGLFDCNADGDDIFAASADERIEQHYADGMPDADAYLHLLCQTLADRLAEAAIECAHQAIRKSYWGYASTEQLSIAELHAERFQGIRPAVGYPSLPDQSLNFDLDALLDFSTIGITLTEHGAMRPHASVSGLMMAHPEARYFSIGCIGNDQLCDYAQRKGRTPEEMRPYLAANLE